MVSQEPGQRESGDKGIEELRITSNLFDELSLKQVEALLAVVQSAEPNKTLIVVSNEVGLGVVPAYPLGRVYRDTLGYVNQRLARTAHGGRYQAFARRGVFMRPEHISR
jgi:adenosyl cobinamide kinase/adenosyl cobinamide phosphate guanylyltransferase